MTDGQKAALCASMDATERLISHLTDAVKELSARVEDIEANVRPLTVSDCRRDIKSEALEAALRSEYGMGTDAILNAAAKYERYLNSAESPA